jgi:hypothetical protein
MKTATVKELKNELSYRSQTELVELCLRLSKFKKENKELLTYLLFESSDEEAFIRGVKEEIESEFEQINTKSYFYIKKSIRKILRNTKKYIRYSKKKETEVELLLFFCETLKEMQPSYKNNVSLVNIFNRQIESIKRSIASLHEDLQFDYGMELDMLLEHE